MGLNTHQIGLLNQSDPRLTGNIKLVVDEDDTFWLSPINTLGFNVDELKHFTSYENSTYGLDIKRFMDKLYIDKKYVYNNTDPELFTAGPRININPEISQPFSYFAPLFFTGHKFPDFFIIFRLDDFEFNSQLFPHYNYHYHLNEDFNHFLDKYLSYSEIVYTHDFRYSKLSKYIRKFEEKVPPAIYNISTQDPNIYNIHGIDYNTGLFNQYNIHFDWRKYMGYTIPQIENWIIDQFQKYNFFSSNIINLEFLFTDDNCTCDYHYHPNESSSSCYYGMYLNKEDIGKFNINLDKLNERYNVSIPNLYSAQDYNNLNITSNDNLKIDVNNFVNDVNFDIEDNTLYVLRDNLSNLYNILSYDDNILTLNANTIDTAMLFGIDKVNRLSIPGNIIKGPTKSTLKLTLDKTTVNVFNESDYISIKSDVLQNNLEWRVIASHDSCCDSDNIGYHKSREITVKAIDCNIQKLTSLNEYHTLNKRTFVAYITFPTIIEFEEGNNIDLFWDNTNDYHYHWEEYEYSGTFNILRIDYDIDADTTTIQVIDLEGTYFYAQDELKNIRAIYRGKNYYYTFFDPVGSTDDVAKRITESFNSFTNRIFDAQYINNEIIFSSKYNGTAFSNYILSYDFTRSQTLLSNFKINDKVLTGKYIYDIDGDLFTTIKRNNIHFSIALDDDNDAAFYVDKTWALSNMTGKELIMTNYGLTPLKQFYVDDDIIYHTSYSEDISETISKYLYYLEDNNYTILTSPTTGTIWGYYQFYPEIYKLKIIDTIEF